MYNYSPKTCLIKDLDGKIYDIVDLWLGNKTPVNISNIQYDFSPKTCLVQNIDGTTVNVIDTILSVANGSGAGTSCLQEVIQARNEYRTLDERLDTENKKIYDTLNAKDYLSFKGEYITVPHSRVGFTKDMQIEGMTYQNLHEKQIYNFYCADVNNGKYTKTNNENSAIVNITEPLTSWYYFDCGAINVSMLKPNTKYTIVGDFKNVSSALLQTGDGQTRITDGVKITNNIAVLTTISDLTTAKEILLYVSVKGVVGEAYAKNIMILEGDHTNSYVPPYFQGIKSVGEDDANEIKYQSTGKNLFNVNNITGGTLVELNGVKCYKFVDSAKNFTLPISGTKNTQYTLKVKALRDKENEDKGINVVFNYDDGTTDIKLFNSGTTNTYTSSPGKTLVSLTGGFNHSLNCYIDLEVTQLEQGTQATQFEQYQENKINILLPYQNGLKGLPNGVSDLIYDKGKGHYLIQKVIKIILNGSESERWSIHSTNGNVIKAGYYNYELYTGYNEKVNTISNVIPSISHTVQFNEDVEGMCVAGGSNGVGNIALNILKSRLKTYDEIGLKNWLQNNPITIYCELATPIEHQLPIDNYELKTYADTTHIFSTNTISPVISCQAPSNPQAVVAELMVENQNLNNELEVKTRELQAKDQTLANEDDLLTAKDLDMDFRIFELEEQLTPEVAKLSMSYNSPYTMIKRCIEKGLYEKEDMLYKMNRYLHGKRLTQEEYDELKLMMG